MGLGQVIRGWRAERGATARVVAQHLGKGRTTIFLWESGSGRPDPVDIRRLGEFLGATEEQIAHALDLRSRMPLEHGTAA